MRTIPLILKTIRRRPAPLAVAMILGVTALACDDPFAIRATLANDFDTAAVYAMSGTASTLVAGYSVSDGRSWRIQSDVGFDVAFDLTTEGKVKLVTARRVSPLKVYFGSLVPTQAVGLQLSQTPFESIGRAPTGGYVADSILTVEPGQSVLAQVTSERCQAQNTLQQSMYAKFVVDSVRINSRQIFFRVVRIPSCGFRTFSVGIPKS